MSLIIFTLAFAHSSPLMAESLQSTLPSTDLVFHQVDSLGKAAFLDVFSESSINHASGTSSAVEPIGAIVGSRNDGTTSKLNPVEIVPTIEIPTYAQDSKPLVGPLSTDHSYPPPQDVSISVIEVIHERTSERRLRMMACFLALFLAGWNGGSTGALIPYIEANYGLNYARVSVLFVCTFIGYVVAAMCTGPLSRRVGFGHALCIAMVVELMGNVINSSQHVSYGLMCFGFFVVGLAFATQLGLANAYFAILDKPLLWTGILHGVYGLGAFASPLVATAMVSRGVRVCGIGLLETTLLTKLSLHALPLEQTNTTNDQQPSSFGSVLKNRAVWTLSIFMMLYVGAEESLGGWIVTYIREMRNGSPEGASWVASSFYLGIALGRIILPVLSIHIGERLSIFLYILLAISLECIAWFVPILTSTAICTALVGFAISTFYAAAITTGGKLLPRSMHADAFALMSSVGQSGSAFWPLMVGVMSTRKGIWVVEPTVVALLGAQFVCWWLVPKIERREE